MNGETVLVSWLGHVRVASPRARMVGTMKESCLVPKEWHLLGEERKQFAGAKVRKVIVLPKSAKPLFSEKQQLTQMPLT